MALSLSFAPCGEGSATERRTLETAPPGAIGGAWSLAQPRSADRVGCLALLAPLGDHSQEVVIGLDKFTHAILLEPPRNFVQVNADVAQVVEERPRIVSVRLETRCRITMVTVSIEGLKRDGIDRSFTDEGLY